MGDWTIRTAGGEKALQRRKFTGDDGRALVDYIVQYENLDRDIARICHKLDVTARPRRVNVSRIAEADDTIPDDLLPELRAFYEADYELYRSLPDFNSGKL